MKLSDVRGIRVQRKRRRRVGRGQGSGWGTTSGRGNKGAGQRSGARFRLHFEGGQMPLYRRLPKKGFTNATFKTSYHVVNVGDLSSTFEADATVDLDRLKTVGLAPKKAKYLKILGWGDIDRPLSVTAHAISRGARTKIEQAQGSVTLVAVRAASRPKGVKKPAPRADEASS